jgi:acyl-coenzyme A thioesterase PaaI-like protein
MQTDEVIGELKELVLGRSGVTTLNILPGMCFLRTGIARGHFLFAQANSLAAALIDSPYTLTATARVRFLRPVRQGDEVTAKAVVTTVQGHRRLVRVTSYVEDKPVFDGRFVVVSANAIQTTDNGLSTEIE